MKSMLANMLVAVVKETRSKRGGSEPVYSEEIELMFEQEGHACQDRMARCMGEINESELSLFQARGLLQHLQVDLVLAKESPLNLGSKE